MVEVVVIVPTWLCSTSVREAKIIVRTTKTLSNASLVFTMRQNVVEIGKI